MTEGWSGQGTAKPRGLNDKGREYAICCTLRGPLPKDGGKFKMDLQDKQDNNTHHPNVIKQILWFRIGRSLKDDSHLHNGKLNQHFKTERLFLCVICDACHCTSVAVNI